MTLTNEPKYFRASGVVGEGSAIVERDGGMFGHGVIRGVSVITRGEALGHQTWIDAEFLNDVGGAINNAAQGIKARFTHPGLSSDGVGKKLGKLSDAWIENDQVFADLHFQEAATKTADGDLADYVMSLAEETPEDFGLSIVFEHDFEAANEHISQNTVTTHGREIYTSPDELNKDNYPHARLAKLRAGDVVDSPAANPNGLFSRGQEAAREGEQILEYALGLSDAKPETVCFNVDGDRVQQFVARFLSRHKLELVKGGDPVSEESNEPTREQFAAELKRYNEAFGEDGAKWFADGVSWSDAQTKQIEKLHAENESLRAKVGELQETIASLDRGEDEGAEFPAEPKTAKRTGLNSRIRISGKHYEAN